MSGQGGQVSLQEAVMEAWFVFFDGTPEHRQLLTVTEDGGTTLAPDLTIEEAILCIGRLADAWSHVSYLARAYHKQMRQLEQQLAEAQPEVAQAKGANSGSAVGYSEPDEFDVLPDVEHYSEHAGGSWTQARQ